MLIPYKISEFKLTLDVFLFDKKSNTEKKTAKVNSEYFADNFYLISIQTECTKLLREIAYVFHYCVSTCSRKSHLTFITHMWTLILGGIYFVFNPPPHKKKRLVLFSTKKTQHWFNKTIFLVKTSIIFGYLSTWFVSKCFCVLGVTSRHLFFYNLTQEILSILLPILYLLEC